MMVVLLTVLNCRVAIRGQVNEARHEQAAMTA
jgi:hypothetical protein